MRGRIGRAWMAIRDMDIAAEIIGIRPLRTKLLAFALSSFYCGIAGAMWAFIYTSAVEASAFEIDRSFQILFMIIIGGLGSILGSFLGAAFIVLLPIFLDNAPRLAGLEVPVNLVTNLQSMIFGALIVFFLDRRAERPGAAVGDRQGKAAALAIPALTPRDGDASPSVSSKGGKEPFAAVPVNGGNAPNSGHSRDRDRARKVRPKAVVRPNLVWRRNRSLPAAHSITSSARSRTPGEIVRPSALAVLRLMINEYFVGC